MAIPPIFIFLSLCIIISQEASVNHVSFENGKHGSFTRLNNNLGIYFEYTGQVGVDFNQHSFRVTYDLEALFTIKELLPALPKVTELLDTFHQLSTIHEKTKCRLYELDWTEPIKALKIQIQPFSGNHFERMLLFAKLRRSALAMEKVANNLLEKIKCVRHNTTYPWEKRILNDIMEDTNITISDINNSATIKVGKLGNKTLAFDYTFPNIDKDQQILRIYRLTPIPKVHRNGTMEILNIDAPYLAVNKMEDTETYYEVHNLELLLKLANNGFICKSSALSKTKHTKSLSCTVAAFLKQYSADCTSHLDVRQYLWTPLFKQNSWMVTVIKETPLLVFCSDDDYKHELKINGSGIVTIRGDCTVRLGTSMVLQGKHTEGRDSFLDYSFLQTKNETAMIVNALQSHVNLVIRDSLTKLKEEHIKQATLNIHMSLVLDLS